MSFSISMTDDGIEALVVVDNHGVEIGLWPTWAAFEETLRRGMLPTPDARITAGLARKLGEAWEARDHALDQLREALLAKENAERIAAGLRVENEKFRVGLIEATRINKEAKLEIIRIRETKEKRVAAGLKSWAAKEAKKRRTG